MFYWCLGQRMKLGAIQLLPAFPKHRANCPFSGGRGLPVCFTVAPGSNVAWCISFCLLSKALLSLHQSGGLGCQMLYGAWGNVAWCIRKVCLLCKCMCGCTSLFFGRAWLPDALRVAWEQTLLGASAVAWAFKACLSLFSGGLGCQMLYGAWGNVAWCSSFACF